MSRARPAASDRRIAFVLPSLSGGGAERAALNLAAAAPRSRCTVLVELQEGELEKDLAASGVVVVTGRTKGQSRLRRTLLIARALKRIRPDLVVSLLSPLVPTLASSLKGVPAMHWLQAPWSRTTATTGSGPTAKAHRATIRLSARRCAMIAAVSPGLLEECRALGIPDSKLALLPNGLLLPPPPVEARGSRRDGMRRIVTVGRLDPPKRHDLLIESMATLNAERPTVLTIVGSGSCEEALRARVQALGLESQIEFAGFLADPTEQIRSADVFVLMTEYEGFGNVIVEALACGTPVVVSDVPYGPRFILDSVPGATLVKSDSAKELADTILATLRKGGPTEREREAARARAEAFSVEAVALRFEELVDEILGAPRRVRSLTAWP